MVKAPPVGRDGRRGLTLKRLDRWRLQARGRKKEEQEEMKAGKKEENEETVKKEEEGNKTRR